MNYVRNNSKLVLLSSIFICLGIFFYIFADISFPFIFGFVLAYLLAPVVNIASKYINRSFISLLLVLCFLAVIMLAGFVLIPKIKDYILYILEHLPQYHENFAKFADQFIDLDVIAPYQTEITALKNEFQKYYDQKLLILTSVIKEIISRKNTIAEFISFFIITPFSLYYFTRDWEKFSVSIYAIIPLPYQPIINEIFLIIRKSFRKFFHAQFYVVAILFAYYSLVLSVIGINNSVFLGLFSGLLSFIPFIGAIIACLIVIFLSITSLTLTKLCILFLVYGTGQIIEGYILSPKFVGKGTGLHPLWILFSFFAGFKLLGIIGVLIAIPVIAMIRDLLNFGIKKLQANQMYKK